jgi:hypothetical protein
MDNKLCTEMAEAILASDGDFSTTVQEHIGQCADCAALAGSWKCLRDVELPPVAEVPPSLDFAVLNAARKAQARNRWMLPKWFYAISSAACAIMFAWLIVYSHQHESRRRASIWNTSRNDQALFMLDSEIEFNQILISTSTESEVDESDINDIVSDIQDVSKDNEFFDSLLTTANEVQLI